MKVLAQLMIQLAKMMKSPHLDDIFICRKTNNQNTDMTQKSWSRTTAEP